MKTVADAAAADLAVAGILMLFSCSQKQHSMLFDAQFNVCD